MAEQRTPWLGLLAQFADNATGDITAEDLRDFVMSARPFVTTAAPTASSDSTLGFDFGHAWLDVTGPAIFVCVDASAAAAVWVQVFPASGGGASAFTDLTDAPGSYAGQGGKLVAVNAGATALEFVTGGGGGIAPLDGVVIVKHGATAGTARPTAGIAYWLGSVAPTNKQLGDFWLETGAYD